MGTYANNRVQAVVRALLLQGYSDRAIERKVGPILGDEAPADNTIGRWRKEWSELGPEQDLSLRSNSRAIALQADGLIQIGLDYLEEHPELIVKNLIPLNAISNTPRDKLLRDRELAKPTGDTNILVLAHIRAQELRKEREAQLLPEVSQ